MEYAELKGSTSRSHKDGRKSYDEGSLDSFELKENDQRRSLLDPEISKPRTQTRRRRCSVFSFFLCTLCAVLIGTNVFTFLKWQHAERTHKDPSLGIYSPASDHVEYYEHHFQAALFNGTKYMGFPTDETDRLWADLYDLGISTISKEEARHLATPTLPIPGTDRYLVQLDVFHELHCLNDLRKIIYPERFPNMSLASITLPNGAVQRDNDMFRHWDHCIDSLRQTLMCHADISPIPFRVATPKAHGIFPRLATTHTCRNFSKIQEWALEHQAGDFKFLLEPDEAKHIIETAGFSQDPEEDIEFLYKLFPGNKFFKYWRTHDACVEMGRCD